MPDRDPCPVCGKPRGMLMESHGDKLPGLMALLRGEAGEFMRLGVTIAVCLLVVLLLTCGQAVPYALGGEDTE